MFNRPAALPLARDATSRFLPWLVGFMVFLAALALAGTLRLHDLIETWTAQAAGTLTVQVLPAKGATTGIDDARVDKVVEALKGTPGVTSAREVSRKRMETLLDPWLGGSGLMKDLPLPRLIDTSIQRSNYIGTDQLKVRLNAVDDNVAVDDHGLWLADLARLARSVETVAVVILGLIGVATAATVIYATRTGLAIHYSAIEVLHIVGAPDAYVARQFSRHATALGLRGGTIGLVLAIPTLLGLDHFATEMPGSLVPALDMGTRDWLALVALVPSVTLLSALTARFTVLRTLARLP